MNISLPLGVAVIAVLVISACDKKDDARIGVTVPPVTAQEKRTPPVEPTPPPPPPNAPDQSVAPLPTPGQANDHSSPVFKAGGQPDPEKKGN